MVLTGLREWEGRGGFVRRLGESRCYVSIPAPLPPPWGRGGGCYLLLFSSLEGRSSERALGELGVCSLGTPVDRFLPHALGMIYDGWREREGERGKAAFLHLGNDYIRPEAAEDWVRIFYGPDVSLGEGRCCRG